MSIIAPEAPARTAVTIQVNGGAPKTVPYVAGRDVGYYLDQAEVKVDRGRAINLGGRTVKRRARVTAPGATITVAKAVSNG